MRRTTMLVPAAMLALVIPASGAAQDATPDPGITPTPDSPYAIECQFEPRPADELLGMWYDTAPALAATEVLATPVAEAITNEVSIPIGPPADDATTVGITATARQLFACLAGGDTLRAYSLFTDQLAGDFRPAPGVSRTDAEAVLNAPPTPQPGTTDSGDITVASPMVLPDGRVGAFIVDRAATGTGSDASYVVFQRQGETWFIDGLVEFAVTFETPGTAGTPTP